MRRAILEYVVLLGTLLVGFSAAIAAGTPPSTGYEISIYDAYPSPLWVCLVAAMGIGTYAIVWSADDGGTLWRYGVAILLVADLVVVTLPFLRGYVMYGRSDALTHLGFARDIAQTGGFGGNIYPPLHLLLVTVSEATGTDVVTLAMTLPVVGSFVFFGGMYYLVVSVFETKRRRLYAVPFALLPVLGYTHVGVRPWDFGVVLFPVVFALFFASRRSADAGLRGLFVIALVAETVYHPLAGLFVLLVLGLYAVAARLPRVELPTTVRGSFLSLALVAFTVWYTSFAGIVLRFQSVYFTLFGASDETAPIDGYTQTVEEASPALVDLLRVFVFTYGLEFLLFGLGVVSTALVGWLVWREGRSLPASAATLLGTLVAFSVGGTVFLVSDLIVPPDRPWQLGKLCALTAVGQLVALCRNRIGWDRWGGPSAFHAVVVSVAVVVIALSVFTVYPAPMASGSNDQVTSHEFAGAAWLAAHDGTPSRVDTHGLSGHRVYDALYGFDDNQGFEERDPPAHFGYDRNVTADVTDDPGFEKGDEETPPAHFGYDHNVTLGEMYDESRYLTLTTLGRIVYPAVFPDYPANWRYTPAEFAQLERDPTVGRIYDNGGYTQYFVTPNETVSSAVRSPDAAQWPPSTTASGGLRGGRSPGVPATPTAGRPDRVPATW